MLDKMKQFDEKLKEMESEGFKFDRETVIFLSLIPCKFIVSIPFPPSIKPLFLFFEWTIS